MDNGGTERSRHAPPRHPPPEGNCPVTAGVETADLREMVRRMEHRLGSHPNPRVRELMAAYHELVPGFAADLPDEREELLSRGGALMLVQRLAGDDATPGADQAAQVIGPVAWRATGAGAPSGARGEGPETAAPWWRFWQRRR